MQKSRAECLKILGLPPDATLKEVKKQFRNMALRYHPDKLSSDATEYDKAQFPIINSAYEQIMTTEADGFITTSEELIFMKMFKNFMSALDTKPDKIFITLELDIDTFFNGVKKVVEINRQTLIDPAGNTVPHEYRCQYITDCNVCNKHGFINSFQFKCCICAGKGYKLEPGYSIGIKKTNIICPIPPWSLRVSKLLNGMGHINPTKLGSCGDIVIESTFSNILNAVGATYVMRILSNQVLIRCTTSSKTAKTIFLPNGKEIPITPDTVALSTFFDAPDNIFVSTSYF